ncbi:helix-turn-helix- domain containing protein, AraC type [gamma proteobacterium NOR5-3]|nr:helix-turn-helix- domain containing protein, AraC type [gamma proteobacterium NOR5-3]
MENIAVARIAHITPFMDVLEHIGSPVYRDLDRWSLPKVMAQHPDRYIPAAPVIACFRSIARREGIEDLGFHASTHWSLSNLNADVLAQIRCWPTLYSRLQQFARLCRIEEPDLRLQLLPEGPNVRVTLELDTPVFDGLEYSNWLQIRSMLDLIRDAAGRNFDPQEITMRGAYIPSSEAHNAYAKTQLLTAHEHTSILVPKTLLSRACASMSTSAATAPSDSCDERLGTVCDANLAARLKLTLPSYLGDGYPAIEKAAAIAHTSVRSLQRELSLLGTSYTSLIQQIRFEEAVKLLDNPAEKIINIALELGYEDASHFARAFKRVAGTSPREYRKRHILH